MKLRNPIPQQKLRAATAARRASQPHVLDDQEEEPTMSLGAAFVVVLLLHVVAVGGVYGFNSLKTHHPAAFEDPAKTAAVAAKVPAVSKPAPLAPAPAAANPVVAAKAPEPAPAVEATKKPAATAAVEAPKKPVAATNEVKETPKDSGEFYIVAKKDNLLSIAKKRHVTYAELVKLNKIEDPAKLKIGQKLRLPAKTKKPGN